MTIIFYPDKNPYANDLVQLSRAPKTRFTHRQRYTFAAVLAARLYGLELAPWRTQYGGVFLKDKRKGRIEVVFEADGFSFFNRLEDRITRSQLVKTGGTHYLLLKVEDDCVRELHNGLWAGERSMRFICDQHRGSVSDALDDPTPPTPDEEACLDYCGDGPSPGGSGGREGGGGGSDGDDGGGDDPAPGAGGIRELLNHPVLFAVDEETLRAILESDQ